MRKIVIASDSFKGSLTSSQVADAVCEGVRAIYPDAEVVKVIIADGGEGTTESITQLIDYSPITITVSDPLGRPVKASYHLIDGGSTAVIETASASGLTLLLKEERNPMSTSTYGTGEMIADALGRGCRRIIIGLGGSATNDGGMGMLSALGYRFYDDEGNTLAGCGASLSRTAGIDDESVMPEVNGAEFIIACDVSNPFFGPDGSAYIFAPQKGADGEMVEELDRGLRLFAARITEFTGKDISEIPGSGAAGGLGGAFMAFMGAKSVRGIDMILDMIGFDGLICGADLIITGEGKIDAQTTKGKAPSGILERAERQGIRTIAVGGIVESRSMGFDAILQTTPATMPLDTAMQPEIAKQNIIQAITEYLSEHQAIN